MTLLFKLCGMVPFYAYCHSVIINNSPFIFIFPSSDYKLLLQSISLKKTVILSKSANAGSLANVTSKKKKKGGGADFKTCYIRLHPCARDLTLHAKLPK